MAGTHAEKKMERNVADMFNVDNIADSAAWKTIMRVFSFFSMPPIKALIITGLAAMLWSIVNTFVWRI